MNQLELVPFGGLASLYNDNLIPLSSALTASDCFLDNGAVVGRNGYRSVLSGAVVGSGTVQHIGRFRPSATAAVTVVVVAGEVFVVSDPTTVTSSDGVATTKGTPFGTTANISGAQLATNYYLASDETGVAMQRIEFTAPSTYTLVSLGSINDPNPPLGSVNSSLSWTLFSSKTPTYTGTIVVQTNANTGFTNMDSAWRGFSATNNGNDDPVYGAIAKYDMTTPFDATTYDWVAVAVSPHDEGGSRGDRRIAIDVSPDGSTYSSIGSIWDVPKAGGAPNLIFCDLRNLPAATRSAIRYWQFRVEGTSGGKFIVYGYMYLPIMMRPNPPKFYIDIYNGSTGQQSKISSEAKTSLAQVLTVPQANPAQYPDSYMTSNSPAKSGSSLAIFSDANPRIFNGPQASGKAMPALTDIGGIITISGTTPSYSGTLTVRLWLDTETGRRLVTTVDKAGSTAYSFTVGYSDAVLSNQQYRPGGVSQKLSALAAHAGRLTGGNLNRWYISSFTPTSDKSNPYVQWPDIAVEDSDGWSFDVAPGPKEYILAENGEGDAVFTLTNEACYQMTDLRPNSLPYLVFRRGAVGRQAYIYAEDRWFWAAFDGVYEAANRSNAEEMTAAVRRTYTDWLIPTSTLCMGYQSRKLYIFQDTRYMRFDFVSKTWTTGTLAHNIRMVACWNDTSGGTLGEQMWLLTSDRKVGRWQAAATRDMQVGTDTTSGTALPDWRFSTGFDTSQVPATVEAVQLDTNGRVRVTLAKTVVYTGPRTGREISFMPQEGQDEVAQPGSAGFRALKFRFQMDAGNTVTVRRAWWSRAGHDGVGG